MNIHQSLKSLYNALNTIPKLFEDDSIPEESMDEYCVKLQNILQDANGDKTPFELGNLFDSSKG
jgi:hypothetical protein